jgi:hypothetical protein
MPDLGRNQNTIVTGRLIEPFEKIRLRRGFLRNRGWMVEVICPWCGRKHYHGWPAPGEPVGTQRRVSHCTRAPGWFDGYEIIVEQGVSND